MAFLGGIFGGGGRNPAQAAMPYLQQQPGVFKEHLSPYEQRGGEAFGNAHDVYSRMAQDPTAYLNEIYAGYNPRKGFDDYKHNELMKAMRASAASGGYAGTPYDNEAQARLFNDLLESDKENWINRVLGIGKTGLEGETHLGDVGFQSANQLAELLGGTLGEQANLAYKGQADRNAQKNSLIRALIQGGATLGGAFLGGPAGAALGSSLGGMFSGSHGGGGSLDSGSWNKYNLGGNSPSQTFGKYY